MQDANSIESPEPLQEEDTPSAPELSATSKAYKPSLPIYADPSFYTMPQATPAPEPVTSDSAPAPRPWSHGRKEQSSAPPPRPRSPRSRWRRNRVMEASQFWQILRHLPQQYWRILTRPGSATFDRELWKASWGAVWIQLLGLVLLNALIVFSTLVWSSLNMMLLKFPNAAASFFNLGFLIPTLIFVGFIAFITLSTHFFNTFIFWALASLLGGRGEFLTHCYCATLIAVPIDILTLMVAYIPHVGPALVLALLIYAFILQVFMIMSVHNLTAPGAIITVLIPALLLWGGVFELFGSQLSRLF